MGKISEFTQADFEVIARDYADLMEAARKRCHNNEELEVINKAFEFANEAHKGVRRRSGEPYILHPIAVAKIVVSNIGLGYKSIVAALLHDVVEDSHWTFEMLEKEGFSDEIIDALRCVTKLSEDEDYDHFIDRISGNRLAVKVKLNDLADNLDLSRLADPGDKDIVRSQKYLRARDRLLERLRELESLK